MSSSNVANSVCEQRMLHVETIGLRLSHDTWVEHCLPIPPHHTVLSALVVSPRGSQ